MNRALTLEQATRLANKLKQHFKYGTADCPKWFGNTCVSMNQDWTYTAGICIPSWSSINDDEQEYIRNLVEGVSIPLRVVIPPVPFVSAERKAVIKKDVPLISDEEANRIIAAKIEDRAAMKAAKLAAKKELHVEIDEVLPEIE